MHPSLFEDPDLYDAHYFTLTKDVRFYQKLALKSGSPVLELGVGTGRIASAILEKGISVVGLDLSFAMVKKAMESFESKGFCGGLRSVAALALTEQRPPPLQFGLVVSDYSCFSLKMKFPLIFAGFNSLQFMCDPSRLPSLFACVKEHLSPNGVFAFDILNDEVEFRFPPKSPYLRESFFDERKSCACEMRETYEFDPKTRIKTAHWKYVWANGDETERKLCFQMYSSKEILQTIKRNGFEVVNHYGDFDGGSCSLVSPKQIFICKSSPNHP